MKKLLLILLLVTCFSQVKSQAHTGYSKSEILLLEPGFTYKWYQQSDGDYALVIQHTAAAFAYYFKTATSNCYLCQSFPYTMGNVNYMTEMYNKKYTITSSSSWTAYLERGAVMYITLKYLSTAPYMGYYFTYAN